MDSLPFSLQFADSMVQDFGFEVESKLSEYDPIRQRGAGVSGTCPTMTYSGPAKGTDTDNDDD